MAGGPGQPDNPHEHVSETSRYLSLLNEPQNTFQGCSKSSENKYIPRSVLARYFTVGGGSLDKLLRETLEEDEHIPLTETISQQYLAVFSILLSIGKGKYLNRCVERDYSDEKLPFFDKPRHFPKSDDGSFFGTFFDAQWRFCPVRMTKNLVNFRIEPEQILALKRRERISSDASSTTYVVEIHGEYDTLVEETSVSYSAPGSGKLASHTYLFKEFDKASKSAYDKELTGLLYLQKSVQLLGKSINGFYGSFIHDETHTIVLEHTDRGNLDMFMNKVPPPRSGEDIIRLWESVLRLHETLHTIHNIDAPYTMEIKNQTLLRGWYQSLCPQNVFVVSGETGSDYDCHFRLASVGTLGEIEGAKLYAAPECLIPKPDTNMQMGDVFSLGCILSEFAVWITMGLSGLNEYRSDRNKEAQGYSTQAMSAFHDGHDLLQAVSFWNNMAIESKADEDKITEALIHQVVEEMLCEEGDARPTTRQLKAKSNKILSRAREQHLADLHRQNSVASNSTGFSSAGRSSKSRLSHWNSVRSDSSGETQPGNGDSTRDWHGNSAIARSSTSYWKPSSAIDEGKEAYTEPTTESQITSPVSPVALPGVQSSERNNRAVEGHDAPESLSFHRENRGSTLSGTDMAALLNGDDKEIVVTRGPLPSPLRPHRPLAQELDSDTQPAQMMPFSGASQQTMRATASSQDRLGMSTRAPEDVPLHTKTEIRPDNDSRLLNPQIDSTNPPSDLSRSQTTISDISVQTRINVQPVGALHKSGSSGEPKSGEAQQASKPQIYKPTLDLIDGLLWLNNKKGSASSAALRDESYLSQVGDRDFVFLIDDSGSMRAHREMTSRCVRLMAWLLKKYDKNGMDLYLMSKSGKIHTRPGHSSDLQRPILKALDECKGVHNVNTRLAQILAEYRGRNASGSGLQTGGRSSFASISGTRVVTGTRKLMIYVISDGNWEGGSEEHLINTIDAVATVLSVQGAPDKAIGIQFIRTTEENRGRFEKLRAGRRGMEGKIVVDTIDLESNVFRSLLGPIVDLWDDGEGS